jgi:hypothetical protein
MTIATNARLVVETISIPLFTGVNASLLQPQAFMAVNALAVRLTGIIVSFLTLGILGSVRFSARKSGLNACG